MIDEIKKVARRHLAADGANLSLRAVARELGMASSAIYRYFASRDDLLTALIVDAYNALGDAVEAADAAVDRGDFSRRWLEICRGIRRWALANPAEYALIFGSPVPGYSAPEETVMAATRTPGALIRVFAEFKPDADAPDAPANVLADFAKVRDQAFPGVPGNVIARASIGWVHAFGMVSFELFGQFNNVVEAREEYFDYQMRQVMTLIGL
jgi:AcrR family transcriptional regulator